MTAKIVRSEEADFEYWLVADREDGVKLEHKIASDMNEGWASRMFSLTWNHTSKTGAQQSWGLVFEDEESFKAFQELFTRSLWEQKFQEPWDKAKATISYHLFSIDFPHKELSRRITVAMF